MIRWIAAVCLCWVACSCSSDDGSNAREAFLQRAQDLRQQCEFGDITGEQFLERYAQLEELSARLVDEDRVEVSKLMEHWGRAASSWKRGSDSALARVRPEIEDGIMHLKVILGEEL